jgi:lysyl-tRNA synthetase class 2
MLHKRAAVLAQLREFFAARGVLEVETPLLCSATVPDPYIHSIPASIDRQTAYLQTSPEYAMKRLLAAGSGPIYQICKAFRQDEQGPLHNPEFTILEWYRLDFDHHDLMNEVEALLDMLLPSLPAERLSYAEAFKTFLGIDPHQADVPTLKACAQSFQDAFSFQGELNRDGWLNLLMSHCIEPQLGKGRPTFIYDFPVSQAALARIRPETPPVASRFEVFYQGIELGNGFHELQAANEQRARFIRDIEYRREHQLPTVPVDEYLLAALAHGLPHCAGIALGVDRLIMLAAGCETVKKVLSFDFSRA